MKKWLLCVLIVVFSLSMFSSCTPKVEDIKIGVYIGAGPATRWDKEKVFMEDYAKKLGIQIEVELNRSTEPDSQLVKCKKLIDNGIGVLIFTPGNNSSPEQIKEILNYAKQKKVTVINYARIVMGESIDLFVGYDSRKMGQSMGKYLAEDVYEGDYLILHGDSNDNNATLLYEGAMSEINKIKDKIRVIGDVEIKNWQPANAKEEIMNFLKNNKYKVDGILAPNDGIAKACREYLDEIERDYGVINNTVITGMDADLDAAKRIVAGKQSMTIYMDLKELAEKAVQQAYNYEKKLAVEINSQFDNKSESSVSSLLINGQVVVKQNLDRILIESGYYTHEEVYG